MNARLNVTKLVPSGNVGFFYGGGGQNVSFEGLFYKFVFEKKR